MMHIFESCFDNKIFDVLENSKPGKAVLLFNHGLGDFVLFLPLFDRLCKEFLNWDLYVGCNPERNFKYLHPRCVIMDAPYGKYDSEYDYIFNIIYPEPPRNDNELKSMNNRFTVNNIEKISKPYLCNILEIGLKNFIWEPYKFPYKVNNKESKKIGVHFFGHTSVQNKDADYFTAELIWNEIKEAGYNPFEIQMLPLNILEFTETPKFIGNSSIRNQFPNLRIMCENILECICFLGVDSGPIYLAGSLLGFDKVLGLERFRKFNKVLPQQINVIDIENYRSNGSIIDFIKGIDI